MTMRRKKAQKTMVRKNRMKTMLRIDPQLAEVVNKYQRMVIEERLKNNRKFLFTSGMGYYIEVILRTKKLELDFKRHERRT